MLGGSKALDLSIFTGSDCISKGQALKMKCCALHISKLMLKREPLSYSCRRQPIASRTSTRFISKGQALKISAS